MKFFNTFIFVIIFGLFFCSWNFLKHSNRNIATKIGADAARLIEKKYGVSVCKFGSGGKPGSELEHVSFGFMVNLDSPTVEEARRWIVPMTDDFLDYMNTYPEIAKEFGKFPLSRKEIILSLIFIDPKKKDIYFPYVWSCCNLKGEIYYRQEVYHPPQPGVYGKDEREHEETFEEAKAILEKEKQANEISSKSLTDANEILPLEKPSP